MKDDELIVEVDESTGLIKTLTPAISSANHSNADGLLKFLARLMGGETTVTRRTKSVHTHAHEHTETKA